LNTKPLISAALAAALSASVPTSAQPAQEPNPSPATAGQRQLVTRAEQLPRHTHTLSKLPSEMLVAPLAELRPLGAKLEAELLADLAAYDIQDTPTLREFYSALATLAQLRGDWAAVPGWTARARALQDKLGGKLSSGITTELLAQQQLEKRTRPGCRPR